MKTMSLVAAVAAGLVLVGVVAQARDGHSARMTMPDFEQLDLNGDGQITPEEMHQARQAMTMERFTEADTDGDGALSAEEMAAAAARFGQSERMAERIARRIERLDANGDGVLQFDEMAREAGPRGGNRMLERFDADNNGSIDAEEFAAMLEKMGEHDQGRRGHIHR